jgi:hypothetical protein
MPRGKGTYGSKRGRPPKKKKSMFKFGKKRKKK